MKTPFVDRVRVCQKQLRDQGFDAVILFPSPNFTYLTGFQETPSERHFLFVVPADGTPTMLAPTMYGEPLEELGLEAVVCWDDDANPLTALERILDEQAVTADGAILLDDRLWATFAQDVRTLRPDATYDLASTVLEAQRARKDEIELAALRRAGIIADRVAREIRTRGEEVVGLTERELASEIDARLEREGGLGSSFETIVAAGANGSRPHHHPGETTIRAGEPVVLDFGCVVNAELAVGDTRYPSDQTRTMVFGGEPADRYVAVHEIVQQAQEAAVQHVEPGVTAQSVDRMAREIIDGAGYGDAFVHRTGHGVGLEIHEPPYIVEGNDRELEPGMVFSVEPGIYLEGEFGVRIEDLVVVTETGCERLNDSPRGWETT